MIPFYFFRKKVESPTSLVYFSGVMDSIDQWGLRDRRDLVRGSKTYANYYALDWALTVGLLALCLKAIEALIYVILGMEWTIDYFDFFMIDDDHMAISVGDVSGRGVPSALFMMISKSVIKSFSKMNSSMDLGTLFRIVNDRIHKHNTEKMYIAVFFGIIELSSGRMKYVNAGHFAHVFPGRFDVQRFQCVCDGLQFVGCAHVLPPFNLRF